MDGSRRERRGDKRVDSERSESSDCFKMVWRRAMSPEVLDSPWIWVTTASRGSMPRDSLRLVRSHRDFATRCSATANTDTAQHKQINTLFLFECVSLKIWNFNRFSIEIEGSIGRRDFKTNWEAWLLICLLEVNVIAFVNTSRVNTLIERQWPSSYLKFN